MLLKKCFGYVFLVALLFFFPSHALFLGELLQSAKPGDYFAVSFYNTDTFLWVEEVGSGYLVLHEISLPGSQKQKSKSWRLWAEEGGVGHTEWGRYTLDLSSKSLLGYYSLTKKMWLTLPESSQFLAKLLCLSFRPVPLEKRKKIGSKPLFGADERRLWQPKFSREGSYPEAVKTSLWQAVWPKDGGVLAGHRIEMYLAEEQTDVWPSYFPIWLQVPDRVGKPKLRLLETGRGLSKLFIGSRTTKRDGRGAF